MILHEVRVTDLSDCDKNIKESEIDYEIKEKIVKARAKAVRKIESWWRMITKKNKGKNKNKIDETDIIFENRIIKMTYNINYLPIDDRFLLRASKLRDDLLSFYLSKMVTSSLDFHFILMTLNKISDLKRTYIKAYKNQSEGLQELGEG